MRKLPGGLITLLFTDIEGSTRLLQRLGEGYAEVLSTCRRLLRSAFEQCGGYEIDTQGDAFFVVFTRTIDAISASVTAQRALFHHCWPDDVAVRVRIGLHTGTPRPSDEGYIGLDVHRAARIMSAGHGGQVLLSETTRKLVEHDLPADLELRDLGEHHLKDIEGQTHLFQLVIADLPVDFPPLSATGPLQPLLDLPAQSTPFIGREQEIARACEVLRRPDVRMLTLIGTAGVGKTRAALQIANELSHLFVDGISFVPLDQASDADGVVSAISQALTIQEEKGQSLLERLKAVLRPKRRLLILDNFEQVIAASLVVADLLAACPKLKILVTSRVVLHLQAEHVFEVPPLALPDTTHLASLEDLSHYAAIELFVQRAQAVQPDFQLTAANARDIARICTRLDGIPLAIELAAARIRYFQPKSLLARLEQGQAVLSGGARDVPARQQTLREAIAWSYTLLTPEEQQVFRRFAVCAGGSSLEAAEQICSAASQPQGMVLERLEALVDKSLLRQRQEAGGETRFWLLQTLREYALECLRDADEMEVTRTAHAAYYLSWAEQVAPLLTGAEQIDWLDRLEQEYDNLRAALGWMLDHAGQQPEQAEQALRLCEALAAFWEIRGYFSEGLGFLERALALGEGVAISVRAEALHLAGFLALVQDEDERAEHHLRASQALFRQSGDKAGMANILRMQGNLARARSTYKIARRLLEEALGLFTELGDTMSVAYTRESLAQVAIAQRDYAQALALLAENLSYYQAQGERYHMAYPLYYRARVLFLSQGDLTQAQAQVEESLTLFKKVKNARLIAYACCLLGQILGIQGEMDRAQTLLKESLTSLKELGDRFGTAESLMAIARLYAADGQYEEARTRYEESWKLLRSIGTKDQGAACLEGLGEVLAAQGDFLWAAQLWGTAATVRATIVAPMHRVYRSAYLQAVASVREHIGNEAFQEAWTRGGQIPLAQALLAQP